MLNSWKRLREACSVRLQGLGLNERLFLGASLVSFGLISLLYFCSGFLTAFRIEDYWIILHYLIRFSILLLLTWILLIVLKRISFFQLGLISLGALSGFLLLHWVLFDKKLSVAVLIVISLFAFALAGLRYLSWRELGQFAKLIWTLIFSVALLGTIGLVSFYSMSGADVRSEIQEKKHTSANGHTLQMLSPADRGSFEVKRLTYGSGRDKHRSIFGNKADFKTNTVDASAFVENWDGLSGWWRTKYWGFDLSEVPLNGIVWYPKGKGPFPLMLIAHGDHAMQDFFEEGYAYLGKLLASRGMIVASVDQNFLNISWSDFYSGRLIEENDARAWLLLEHLKLWHQWNQEQENPFYDKIDITKLALMGHSKGGEAIAVATLFNDMDHYPGDPSIPFDYHFNISTDALKFNR